MEKGPSQDVLPAQEEWEKKERGVRDFIWTMFKQWTAERDAQNSKKARYGVSRLLSIHKAVNQQRPYSGTIDFGIIFNTLDGL